MTDSREDAPEKISPRRLRELVALSDQLVAAEATFKLFLKIKLQREAIQDFVIGLGPKRAGA